MGGVRRNMTLGVYVARHSTAGPVPSAESAWATNRPSVTTQRALMGTEGRKERYTIMGAAHVKTHVDWT